MLAHLAPGARLDLFQIFAVRAPYNVPGQLCDKSMYVSGVLSAACQHALLVSAWVGQEVLHKSFLRHRN